MNKKKIYIIIAIVVLVYIAFSLFITSIVTGTRKHYLFIGNEAKWRYDKSWVNLADSMVERLDLSEYKVYNTNTGDLIGTYDIEYDAEFVLGDELDDVANSNNVLLMYKGNDKFNMIKFNQEEFVNSDYNLLKQVLNSLDITNYSQLNIEDKVVIDLNDDQKNETIYIASNMYVEEGEDIYFSLVYVQYSNGNYQILLSNKIISDSLLEKVQSTLFAIVDLTGDKNYELITSTSGFSLTTGNEYTMFGIKNGKYQKIIANS